MTHEDRLALIYRPFMITRLTTSYPHGGTIAVNTALDLNARYNYVLVGGKRLPLPHASSGFQIVNGRPYDVTKFEGVE